MTEPIRVGVIGTSWWAEAMHLSSLASHPQATLAAVCGRNPERAAALAARYAIPQVFADYRAMIAQGGLDALVIVTPDDLHYTMALAGLERGLHVLCEKPLALTLRQARTMAERAARAGVKHMVGFSWRGLPHYRHLRELVRAGYLGRVHTAHFSYLSGGGARGAYSWRYDRGRSNGALGNYGSHMIDLAHWLLGDIARVSARLVARVARPGPAGRPAAPANDLAHLLVEFEGGATGSIEASEVAEVGERFHEQRVRLYGEAGTLEADLSLSGSDLSRGEVRVAAELRGARRGEGRFTPLPVPPALEGAGGQGALFEPFLRQAVGDREFIDAIVLDRMPEPSFFDGLRTQAVMEAAVTAHRLARWVAVARDDPVGRPEREAEEGPFAYFR